MLLGRPNFSLTNTKFSVEVSVLVYGMLCLIRLLSQTIMSMQLEAMSFSVRTESTAHGIEH